MNLFKRIYKTVEPEVRRFPGVVLATIIAAFTVIIINKNSMSLNDKSLVSVLCKSSLWSIPFTIFVSFLVEFLLSRKYDEKKVRNISFISQTASLFICYFPLYFLFKRTDIYFWNFYFCSILAMIAMCLFFVTFQKRDEDVIPEFVSAILISLVISGFATAALCLILWSIDSLLFKVLDNYFIAIIIASFLVLFVNCTLAYTTRQSGTERTAKLFKFIVKSLLFSLYIVLIAVFYAYLIKSFFTKTIPEGKINGFVSFASIFYLFFFLSLRNYKDDKIIVFFYRHGQLFLLPLIALQCIALGIRVSAYGLTFLRYESLLYIIFTIIVVWLASFKEGRFIKYVYPVFAAMLLIASVTPLNFEDVPRRDQMYRIERIYKKHNLYSDGTFKTQEADRIFTQEEKEIIQGAYDYLKKSTVVPNRAWWKEGSFGKMFGFNYSSHLLNERNALVFRAGMVDSNYVLDVKDYSTLIRLQTHGKIEADQKKIYVYDIAGNEYEITSLIMPLLKKADEAEPENMTEIRIFKLSDDVSLFFDSLDIYIFDEESSCITVSGFAAVK